MIGLAVNILYVCMQSCIPILKGKKLSIYVFIFIVYFTVHLLVSKIDVHTIADLQAYCTLLLVLYWKKSCLTYFILCFLVTENRNCIFSAHNAVGKVRVVDFVW